MVHGSLCLRVIIQPKREGSSRKRANEDKPLSSSHHDSVRYSLHSHDGYPVQRASETFDIGEKDKAPPINDLHKVQKGGFNSCVSTRPRFVPCMKIVQIMQA